MEQCWAGKAHEITQTESQRMRDEASLNEYSRDWVEGVRIRETKFLYTLITDNSNALIGDFCAQLTQ